MPTRRTLRAGPPPKRRVRRGRLAAVAVVLLVVIAAPFLVRHLAGRRGAERQVASVVVPVPPPGSASAPDALPPPDPDYLHRIEGGDPALIERAVSGPLPRVAADGREAWRVYDAPFDGGSDRPRIAVVIAGLGQSAAETQLAIDRLPAAVTLAFSPYGHDLPDWIAKARAARHEVLLEVPMEPADFPRQDPGPETLLTTLSPEQNLDRLEWSLSRAVGYVGLSNLMGARFTASPAALKPILEVIKGRGLLFLERRAAVESAVPALAADFALPYAASDGDLDADLSPSGIDQALGAVEQTARRQNRAVAVGSLYPLTVARVAAWAATLAGKDLVLAPVSATIAPIQPAVGAAGAAAAEANKP